MDRDGDRQALVIAVPGIVLVGVVALFVIAATRSDPADRTVWFAAIAAGVAVVGVFAAAFAVYRSDVLEKPQPHVTIEVTNPMGDGFVPVEHDTEVTVHGLSRPQGRRAYQARIHVTNTGRGVLRWGIINIQVLRECDIDPIFTSPSSGHEKALTPFNSAELVPGSTVLCNATKAERDYPPVHSFLYCVEVNVPRPGVWPLAAVLDGFPATKKATRAWTRVDINVT